MNILKAIGWKIGDIGFAPESAASSSVSPSASISPSISSSLSPSASASPSLSPSVSMSPSLSPSASGSPSLSPSASNSPSVSPSVSTSPSLSPSASVSPSPSEGFQSYTRGDENVLPLNNNDLETAYSAQDLIDVSSKNDVRVAQTAIQEYMIHEFKDFVGANNSCTIECELQTTLVPSSSTVYLQIYNRTSIEWDTIDSDNTSDVNTDFILTANVADLTDYKDGSSVISCRVYQEAL